VFVVTCFVDVDDLPYKLTSCRYNMLV